ncbi:MAG TPA: ribonuclease E inhibitor RraB [Rhizomicrobium sp.]
MSAIVIDPARLAGTLTSDADVIRSLRENGDVATIVRPVDVRFIGDAAKIPLLGELQKAGWRLIQILNLDDGRQALDVQYDLTTEVAALRALTEAALRIEVDWDVEYDGWGTVIRR